MTDQQIWTVVCGVFGMALGVLWQASRWLRVWREESRQWRRLMQLYFEKQVNAPLPIDDDPDAPAESSLHLPAEDLEDLERWDEELHA